ncbi:transglutaminase domain-containing protein [Bacteroides thetaiotaomicron]|uniref:transglutaminase domain-containing protein n=1 Tax=Bacteroides thetaiotaomicron TaxID=818 RepID=UPI001F2000A5|nr:transglutaminase domain-containing protein [Bacteroides thetaiotaomicron]
MQTRLLLFIIVMCSCASNKYERKAWETLDNSDDNIVELTNFLEYYQSAGDNEKYEAACYLVSNMSGKHTTDQNLIYDIKVIKADSLIWSLERSFALREESKFLKDYSFDQFLEYILPYRIADEPLEFYWKQDCRKRYAIDNDTDIITAAKSINEQVKLELSPDNYGDLPKSYSSLTNNGYGKCNDRSTLLVMALRANGIPAAYEFVPYWGSSNNGHSFVSVILPDGKIYPLQNTNKITNDSYISRKTPKIYRRMYKLQLQEKAIADLPELFKYNDIIDVTELHRIGSRNVQISGDLTDKTRAYYLSVFSPASWIPVAASSSTDFSYVGTGTNSMQEKTKEAIDLGNGIVYLPVQWTNDDIIPVGAPVIVSDHSVVAITADISQSERVVLKRKYPLNLRIVDFAKLMVMGVFEGANKADFSDAENLYTITDTPKSKMQVIEISTEKSFRYVRYIRPKGTFSIAEFSLYHSNGESLPFLPIACEAIREDSTMVNVFDQNPLTYYQVAGGVDMWVGADLGKPVKINKIGFAPRNDDNAVVSTDTYELFYWQDKWISLGKKQPDGDSVVYDNVPVKALLWLRDLTKGREERPFTYENGKQIWW